MKTKIMRFLLRLFWIFPIKEDRVVACSFNGRLFSCNPKYLAIGIAKAGKHHVYFAMRKGMKAELPEGIERVDYQSLKHFFLLMTAKCIIVNSTGFTAQLPYRRRQILINTWHGAGMFKVSGGEIFKSKKAAYIRTLFSKNTTYFLSSSAQYSERQSSAFGVDIKKFVPTGLPRDDIFFEDHPEIIRKVKDYYQISCEKKLILYAPTYRDGPVTSLKDYGFPLMDIDRVIEACQKRFGGEFVFVFRAHHDTIPENIADNCVNASDYPDVQELLYASDVLISDYSSLQWDFALQYKPGFLYSPDLKQYESVHPFASDPEEWPFETAADNDELEKMIIGYDTDAGKKRIDDYFANLGSFEKGNATEQTMEIAFYSDKKH